MKIISYNVNGIRAALKKNWINWLQSANPDVICLQEIKANSDQLDLSIFEEAGYKTYWFSAQKKGYSGVAIFSKTEPKHVEYGCGIETSDFEGRVIRADFNDVSVISVYIPSGTNEARQGFKMEFLADFQNYINELKKDFPNLIICGDYNICHTAIDIHNPIRNKDTSGFKPEERKWISKFIESGFVDSFRELNKEPHNYSWWSYRAGSRGKNLGWRIDYNMVSKSLQSKITHAAILSSAIHSDHCPVLVEINV